MDLRYRKAARVVACLELIWSFVWFLLLVLAAEYLDEMTCVAIKGNGTGSDECGRSENLVPRLLYGSKKHPYSVMMWKLVVVILAAVAIPQWNTSSKLFLAAKKGCTAAEVLKKMSDEWRTGDLMLLDTGILCSYFIGSWKLFGACLVVRLPLRFTIWLFKSELESESGVKALLDSKENKPTQFSTELNVLVCLLSVIIFQYYYYNY